MKYYVPCYVCEEVQERDRNWQHIICFKCQRARLLRNAKKYYRQRNIAVKPKYVPKPKKKKVKVIKIVTPRLLHLREERLKEVHDWCDYQFHRIRNKQK